MVRRRWRWRPAAKPLRVYLIGAAILALLWQGLLLAAGALFPDTAVAGYGTVESSCMVKAAFLRRESLVAAPADGNFRPTLAAGERAARFGAIGEIRRAGRTPVAVVAPSPGLVLYTLDPQRGVPGHLRSSDPEAAMAEAARFQPRPVRGFVRRGDPVARLVDDLEQYVLCRLAGCPAKPAPGGKVWIREGGRLIPLTVVEVRRDGAATWLILRAERFPLSWLGEYARRAELVTARYTGTTVPRRYLREKNGQLGVTVMAGGRASFRPVQLRGTDGRLAVVEGLREGDIVLPR